MWMGYSAWSWLAFCIFMTALGLLVWDRARPIKIALSGGSIRTGSVGITIYRRANPVRFWERIAWNALIAALCMSSIIYGLALLTFHLLRSSVP